MQMSNGDQYFVLLNAIKLLLSALKKMYMLKQYITNKVHNFTNVVSSESIYAYNKQ